jgi:hypothetical protein
MDNLPNSSSTKALLLSIHLWYNTEDKLRAYPPEYIYNVQRLVSSGWSGFRYRFIIFCDKRSPTSWLSVHFSALDVVAHPIASGTP